MPLHELPVKTACVVCGKSLKGAPVLRYNLRGNYCQACDEDCEKRAEQIKYDDIVEILKKLALSWCPQCGREAEDFYPSSGKHPYVCIGCADFLQEKTEWV